MGKVIGPFSPTGIGLLRAENDPLVQEQAHGVTSCGKKRKEKKLEKKSCQKNLEKQMKEKEKEQQEEDRVEKEEKEKTQKWRYKWFSSVCNSLQGFLQRNFDILVPEAINERVQHGYSICIKH